MLGFRFANNSHIRGGLLIHGRAEARIIGGRVRVRARARARVGVGVRVRVRVRGSGPWTEPLLFLKEVGLGIVVHLHAGLPCTLGSQSGFGLGTECSYS